MSFMYNDNNKVERYVRRQGLYVCTVMIELMVLFYNQLIYVCFCNREDGQPFIMQVTKDMQISSMY